MLWVYTSKSSFSLMNRLWKGEVWKTTIIKINEKYSLPWFSLCGSTLSGWSCFSIINHLLEWTKKYCHQKNITLEQNHGQRRVVLNLFFLKLLEMDYCEWRYFMKTEWWLSNNNFHKKSLSDRIYVLSFKIEHKFHKIQR